MGIGTHYFRLRLYYYSHDVVCDSHVTIYGHFEKSGRKLLRKQIISGKSFNFGLHYICKTTDKLKRLEVLADRYYRKGLKGKCTYGHGGDTKWIEIADSHYPESQNRYNGITGYDGTSNIYVRILPLTNTRLLTLTSSLDVPRYLTFESMTVQINAPGTILIHTTSSNQRFEVAPGIPVNDTIYAADIYSGYMNMLKIGVYSSGFSSYEQKVDMPIDQIPYTATMNLTHFSINAHYDLVKAPVEIPDGYITDDDLTTVIATGGFGKEHITWQYCVGDNPNGPWHNLPDSFHKQDIIKVNARSVNLQPSQYKQKVYFRYYVGTNSERYSSWATVSYMRQAPAISLFKKEDPTCSYKEDGRAGIQLSRPLKPDESLNFAVTTDKDDFTKINWSNLSRSDFDENNRFTLESLKKGSYKVKINVKIGEFPAISNDSIMFDIQPPDIVSLTSRAFDVNCSGGHDGRIAMDASGGTGPYHVEYSEKWTPGSDMTTPTFTGVDTIKGLKPGTYFLRIYDSKGCHAGDDANIVPVVNRSISQPSDSTMIVPDQADPPRGFGLTDGTIRVYGDRGTPDYHFIWKKNGEDFSEHQQTGVFSTADLTVGDGLYHIRVQDSRYAAAMRLNSDESNIRGCYDTVSIRIIEPPKLEVMLAVRDSILCYGDANGSIVARARGGVPYDDGDGSYRYEWSEVRPYQGDRDTILKDLPAGMYSVTVIDGNGITSSITYTLIQPDKLQAAVTGNAILCDGDTNGRVETSVTGGTRPYLYQWSSAHAQMDGNTRVVENLTGGKYAVEVTDYHRCVTVATGEVSVPRGMLTPDTIVTPPVCHDASDGMIIMPVTGGAGGYRYLWNTGAVTPNLSGIPAGRYSVRVTDANNCFIQRRFSLSNPAPLSVNIGPDLTLCRDQSAMLSAAMPDPRASYRWFNRYGLFNEEPAVEVSSPGEYRVAVTDGNGCTGGATVTVTVSDVEITADFVAAEKAACTIPACFVNISHPAPDRVEWIIPGDPSVTVIRQDDEQVEVRFNREGVYRVGLRSQVGDCEKTVYRDITVVGKYDLSEYEPQQEAFLKQFKLWPNPNNGQFTVLAELSETADIQLRLITSAGVVNEVRQLAGSDRYEEIFTTKGKLNPGVYILQLVSKKAVAAIQVVIN